jgi:transcriptional regulator with XRE-family HTH domain
MTDNLEKFAKRLKELRLENDYSQERLAELIDCPPSLISYYESKQREPGFSNILAFCKVFGETPDYMMGVSDYRSLKKIAKRENCWKMGNNEGEIIDEARY